MSIAACPRGESAGVALPSAASAKKLSPASALASEEPPPCPLFSVPSSEHAAIASAATAKERKAMCRMIDMITPEGKGDAAVLC